MERAQGGEREGGDGRQDETDGRPAAGRSGRRREGRVGTGRRHGRRTRITGGGARTRGTRGQRHGATIRWRWRERGSRGHRRARASRARRRGHRAMRGCRSGGRGHRRSGSRRGPRCRRGRGWARAVAGDRRGHACRLVLIVETDRVAVVEGDIGYPQAGRLPRPCPTGHEQRPERVGALEAARRIGSRFTVDLADGQAEVAAVVDRPPLEPRPLDGVRATERRGRERDTALEGRPVAVFHDHGDTMGRRRSRAGRCRARPRDDRGRDQQDEAQNP